MKRKVTIQDIADALGISRNTVSKAINNADGLADSTRDRILQKAVEMGYKQFSYVSALSGIAKEGPAHSLIDGGFSGEIALFTTTFLSHSHFASLMLDNFQQEISQLGYTLNTHRIDAACRKALALPRTFSRERTNAIICIEMFDRKYDEMVCELGLPVLFVDGPANCRGEALPADQLYMDNQTGVIKIVCDAVDAGKKRIGFIGDYTHCQSFFERYMSFRSAMFLKNVPVDQRFCLRCIQKEDIARALRILPELPDLFICANDFVAVDTVQLLQESGKNVPRDVWVCGYDDSAESRILTPKLTTVHIHTQTMAFSAAHLLMSRIKEPSLDYRTIYTQADLIYRESTGFDGRAHL